MKSFFNRVSKPLLIVSVIFVAVGLAVWGGWRSLAPDTRCGLLGRVLESDYPHFSQFGGAGGGSEVSLLTICHAPKDDTCVAVLRSSEQYDTLDQTWTIFTKNIFTKKNSHEILEGIDNIPTHFPIERLRSPAKSARLIQEYIADTCDQLDPTLSLLYTDPVGDDWVDYYDRPYGRYTVMLPPDWVTQEGVLWLPIDPSAPKGDALHGYPDRRVMIAVLRHPANGQSLEQLSANAADDDERTPWIISGLDANIVQCGGIQFRQCVISTYGKDVYEVSVYGVDLKDENDPHARTVRTILQSMNFFPYSGGPWSSI